MTLLLKRKIESVAGLVAIVALSACGNDEAQREQSDDAAVSTVRSALLKTDGFVSGEFRPVDVSKAYLTGNCDPNMFANFGIVFASDTHRQVSVTFMTKDAIASGQVGPVELKWVWIDLTDDADEHTEFRGPGEFEITAHDANTPRMAGTLRGKIPGFSGVFHGSEVLPNESIDVEFTFDLSAACGAFEN
ncbi:MAG: hypothetical protein OEQ39_13965 [Gammaproteobacteria bacterium]|nr:hypothetical protein [Gammaproteobacteria bacterium]MDH3467437.1 hypothetical protein [Gammaproteobacteria bacterium]